MWKMDWHFHIAYEKSYGTIIEGTTTADVSKFLSSNNNAELILKSFNFVYFVFATGVLTDYHETGNLEDEPNYGKNVLFKKQDLIYTFNFKQINE